MRSRILRPSSMNKMPEDMILKSCLATHDGFAGKVGFEVDASPEDPVSGCFYHRFSAILMSFQSSLPWM